MHFVLFTNCINVCLCGTLGGPYIGDMWLVVNFQLQFSNYNISQFPVLRNFTVFCLHLNDRSG
jgi:hypothetical protein